MTLYLPLDHVRRRVSIHVFRYDLLKKLMDLETRNNPSGIFLSAIGPLYLVGSFHNNKLEHILTEITEGTCTCNIYNHKTRQQRTKTHRSCRESLSPQ